MRRIVIIGATSAIAQHCARIWLLREASDIVLCGRDIARLERVAGDLRVRSPASRIETRLVEFNDPAAIATQVDAICEGSSPDIALIAHGVLPQQDECQRDLAAANTALQVTGVSPVLYAEAFAKHMGQANRGTLIVIGSVAGDRGRKKNYVYGAGKALVDRYVEGLQHRFAATQVKVVLAKPGPTETPMTMGLDGRPGRLAPVDVVARQIVDGASRGKAVIYAPPVWRLIMLVIRHLPRFVFNKLDI
ncbi:MAG TPA: SDR family NAD(P)-dependent oxidoreductase [Ramlibacter sp.]|nr:SDR family NAD(P)-dependent oxidoreductase [Ramlibacter sp.]